MMNIKIIKKILVAFMLLTIALPPCFADKKFVAITIDDLPFVGEAKNFHLNMILATLKQNQIPATGFIIANQVHSDNWDMLHKFKDAGFTLGNHTYSHANLNRLTTEAYIQEIGKADKLLSPVMSKPKYFRYPYLAMGTGAKKNAILHYLAEQHYQIAPITIDSQDFIYNQTLLSVPELERRELLTSMEPFYLAHVWRQTLKAEKRIRPNKVQILLIHANLLNAYVLPDLIKLYKENGYGFISLEEALNKSHS